MNRRERRSQVGVLAGFMALLGLLLWQLGSPPLQWDEGWTLSVARSWAERGVYGRLRADVPIGPGLSASPFVTLPTSWGLALFGSGVWQGRLFVALSAWLALIGLTWLAARVYDPRRAAGALCAVLLLAGLPDLHPLLLGRQVYAEMPLLLLLVAGYLALFYALSGRWGWLLPAALCMALALETKAQTAPFLAVSLGGTLLALAAQRRWRPAAIVAATLAGSWALRWPLGALVWGYLAGHVPPGEPVEGLLDVIAVVPQLFNRQYALLTVLLFALPLVFGLLAAARALWRQLRVGWPTDAREPQLIGRLLLLLLSGSWLLWYALLSVGTPRYLFPAVFVGAVFTGAWLHDVTDGYRLGALLERTAALVRRPTPGAPGRLAGLGAFGILLLIPLSIGLTSLGLVRYYPGSGAETAVRVAARLNALPAGTRIETYESELHFLLNQPYHYPPDQLHVMLNRRSLLGQEITVDYDPLASDPDYLVVGRFATENDLYEPWLKRGAFTLLARDGLYAIYQRVR